MDEGIRLQKALADLGLGSRRQIEAWITAGRVAVNGATASLGQRVDSDDRITVDGKPVRAAQAAPRLPRVIAYSKPDG